MTGLREQLERVEDLLRQARFTVLDSKRDRCLEDARQIVRGILDDLNKDPKPFVVAGNIR